MDRCNKSAAPRDIAQVNEWFLEKARAKQAGSQLDNGQNARRSNGGRGTQKNPQKTARSVSSLTLPAQPSANMEIPAPTERVEPDYAIMDTDESYFSTKIKQEDTDDYSSVPIQPVKKKGPRMRKRGVDYIIVND